MKKQLPAFLAGMLTTALVCGLTVSALAANGLLTIDVDPSVTIKVNGEVFQPKNEQGEDVMVFKFGGTTYAPVRALAEVYGLEVGFDQSSNMATVDKPTTSDNAAAPTDYSDWTPEEEAAYQEFKGMWEVKEVGRGVEKEVSKSYIGYVALSDAYPYDEVDFRFSTRMAQELYLENDLDSDGFNIVFQGKGKTYGTGWYVK